MDGFEVAHTLLRFSTYWIIGIIQIIGIRLSIKPDEENQIDQGE